MCNVQTYSSVFSIYESKAFTTGVCGFSEVRGRQFYDRPGTLLGDIKEPRLLCFSEEITARLM